ncbi:MAG: hypothetical protein KDA84_05085 [Planctomycetaceae bacterium]|nr:hypothetical protein [Planctomycetaceae bacterium]
MMRTAICAGIFANYPALKAVLANAEDKLLDRFVFLGDATVAGPFPYECLWWVRGACDWSFSGTWDRGLANPDVICSSAVHRVETMYWNREIVLQHPDGEELIQYAASQAFERNEGDILYLYGSISHPAIGFLPNTYSDQKPCFRSEKAKKEYDLLPAHIRICFVGGGWGIPCVIWPDGLVEHESVRSRTWGEPGNERVIVNVGSVGLPQDRDPRACYVIYDDEIPSFTFHRVEYDVEEVVKAFQEATTLSQHCREWMIERHRKGV